MSFDFREVRRITDLVPMRDGTFHPVDVLAVRASLYEEPVLFTSDLHKDFGAVLDILETLIVPSEWTFVAAGDMSGTTRFGEDGNPSNDYRRVRSTYRKFYFVDGNHDRTDLDVFSLENADGTPCSLDRTTGRIGSRTVTGVSGIMSRSSAPGRSSRIQFELALERALEIRGLHTFVSHDTPKVAGFQPFIGNTVLSDHISFQPPAIHVFGHCHLSPVCVESNGTAFVNVDRRVVLFECP